MPFLQPPFTKSVAYGLQIVGYIYGALRLEVVYVHSLEMPRGMFIPQHILVLRTSTDGVLSAYEPATNAQPGKKAYVAHTMCGLTRSVLCFRVLWTLSTLKALEYTFGRGDVAPLF